MNGLPLSVLTLSMALAAVFLTPGLVAVGLGLIAPLPQPGHARQWMIALALSTLTTLMVVSLLTAAATVTAFQFQWPYHAGPFVQASWSAAIYGILGTWSLGLMFASLGLMLRSYVRTLSQPWQQWMLALSWIVVADLAGLVFESRWGTFYQMVFWSTRIYEYGIVIPVRGIFVPQNIFWIFIALGITMTVTAVGVDRIPVTPSEPAP
jgi:hypothetical protein